MNRLVLAGAAALVAASAHAQPPPTGWVGQFDTPSILCDTSDQVQSIVDAFEDGLDAAHARFAELYKTMNDRREPTCAMAAVRMVTTGEFTQLGRFSIAGDEVYGWIVKVANAGGEGYILYIETLPMALENSI